MKKKRYCVLCGCKMKPGEWGNNPEPIKPYSEGTCCDKCNMEKVLPARLSALKKEDANEKVSN